MNFLILKIMSPDKNILEEKIALSFFRRTNIKKVKHILNRNFALHLDPICAVYMMDKFYVALFSIAML